MKKKLFIISALVALLLFAFVGSAFAETTVQPDGTVAVTSVTYEGATNYKDPRTGKITTVVTPKTTVTRSGSIQLASGSGVTSSYSGWRRITVKTSMYVLGDKVWEYQTPWYWTWKAGKVTYFRKEASLYPHRSLFYFWSGETSDAPDWNTYRTQVYNWKRAQIDFRITKFGVLYEDNCLHEIWAKGNGTYIWHAHL